MGPGSGFVSGSLIYRTLSGNRVEGLGLIECPRTVDSCLCPCSEDTLHGTYWLSPHKTEVTDANVLSSYTVSILWWRCPSNGMTPFPCVLLHLQQLQDSDLEDAPEGGESSALSRILPSAFSWFPGRVLAGEQSLTSPSTTERADFHTGTHLPIPPPPLTPSSRSSNLFSPSL